MATRQTAFRLPEDLLERLDAYAAKLTRELPGLQVNRADAVRRLLEMALEREGLGAKGAAKGRRAR
jgi:predicted DNA-binding protein